MPLLLASKRFDLLSSTEAVRLRYAYLLGLISAQPGSQLLQLLQRFSQRNGSLRIELDKKARRCSEFLSITEVLS